MFRVCDYRAEFITSISSILNLERCALYFITIRFFIEKYTEETRILCTFKYICCAKYHFSLSISLYIMQLCFAFQIQ